MATWESWVELDSFERSSTELCAVIASITSMLLNLIGLLITLWMHDCRDGLRIDFAIAVILTGWIFFSMVDKTTQKRRTKRKFLSSVFFSTFFIMNYNLLCEEMSVWFTSGWPNSLFVAAVDHFTIQLNNFLLLYSQKKSLHNNKEIFSVFSPTTFQRFFFSFLSLWSALMTGDIKMRENESFFYQ